jgi:hypothetical protein
MNDVTKLVVPMSSSAKHELPDVLPELELVGCVGEHRRYRVLLRPSLPPLLLTLI